jgi:hypothetical protein
MALDYIIHLPMNESDNSSRAYDYSPNRNDGIVSGGANFVLGKSGKAINFTGNGARCDVAMQSTQFILSSSFTFAAWVCANQLSVGSPTKFIVMFAFAGVENYHNYEVKIIPGAWYHIAMVRDGYSYIIYVNGVAMHTFTHTGTLTGFSINQDCYSGDLGVGKVDEVVAVQSALPAIEILGLMSTGTKQAYTIDGVDFKDFGVFVSDSDGIIDRPKIKTPRVDVWDNYHGEVVDMNHIYLEPRAITLSCFIKAGNRAEFLDKVFRFEQMFDSAGLHRLMIDVGAKPLVYNVYCSDTIAVSKKWNDALMVGTFKLKLTEPEPVKRVLKHYVTDNAGTEVCAVTIKSAKYLNIYWGDGSVDYDVCGDSSTAQTIAHTYAAVGEYYPVITGCIDEIVSFDTTSIIVWDKL